MKKIVIVVSALMILSSCSRQILVTQGASGYAGVLDNKYKVEQLETVNGSGQSFFGFGDLGKRDGEIVNLSGYSTITSNLLKLVTFISYSAILPSLTAFDMVNTLGGLLIGGVLNNVTYIQTSDNIARRNANLQLIQENPDIDLFIYPKYNIEKKNGLFYNSTKVSITSKGAKIETEQ